MMNKVFDEQALLLEIERVFGRWGSHADVFKGLLEKLERIEKERSLLLNCIADLRTVHNDYFVQQTLEELGILAQQENEPFVLASLHRM